MSCRSGSSFKVQQAYNGEVRGWKVGGIIFVSLLLMENPTDLCGAEPN